MLPLGPAMHFSVMTIASFIIKGYYH